MKTTTNEKTFEQLILESVEIADKRKKIFKELAMSIKTKLLPSLADVLQKYNCNYVILNLHKRPITSAASSYDCFHGENVYAIKICSNGDVYDCYNNQDTGWEWENNNNLTYDLKICAHGAIEFANKIKGAIVKLNTKYERLNVQADSLLKEAIVNEN